MSSISLFSQRKRIWFLLFLIRISIRFEKLLKSLRNSLKVRKMVLVRISILISLLREIIFGCFKSNKMLLNWNKNWFFKKIKIVLFNLMLLDSSRKRKIRIFFHLKYNKNLNNKRKKINHIQIFINRSRNILIKNSRSSIRHKYWIFCIKICNYFF